MISEAKIIFMGTPEFGAIVLEELFKTNLKPILVITAPDKPIGRKQILTSPPTKISAQKYNIPVLQPEKIVNCKLKIENLQPDLVVVAAYGQILPKEILDIPKYGCLNVHPSLLPKYRGPSPIQSVILNGDNETGTTIILMNEKMDQGPILINSKFQIPNSKITYLKLHDKLAELGAGLLLEIIPKWIKGEIKPKTQDHSKATYTKILRKEDGKIDWEKPAQEIERQIRAFNPWPSTYTNVKLKAKNEKRLKILKARASAKFNTRTYPVGKVLTTSQNELCIQCGKEFLIIEELQLEGKKKMTALEFLRGHSNFIGIILN